MSGLPKGKHYYLKEDTGEAFPANINMPIPYGFVDASHATNPRKMRSITGLVYTFNRGAVVYHSKTQGLTASSSTEAELVAANSARKIARYLRRILIELKVAQEVPTKVHIDNLPALQIMNKNTSPTEGSRYMDIWFFSLQDWREEGDLVMVHIHIKGTLNMSDDLTKSLGYILHARHCCPMMGHYG